MRKVVTFFLVALLIIIAVYLVRQYPTGSDNLHSQQIEAADPRHEELFSACVAERDREIHRKIFATIDNPDVQREILATEKERAIRDCRALYPPL